MTERKRWIAGVWLVSTLAGCSQWMGQFKSTPPEWEDTGPEETGTPGAQALDSSDSGKRRYKREDFVDSNSNEGSLWASDGQTNFFFTKNKIKSRGDLISVQLEDAVVKEIAQAFKQALTSDETEQELRRLTLEREKLAEEKEKKAELAAKAPPPSAKGGASRSPAKAASEASGASDEAADAPLTPADIDVLGALSAKPGDKWLAEVSQRYANGNYRLRLTKRIEFRGITKTVALQAIVRGGDIDDTDSITTGKLYEHHVRVYR